MVLTAVRNVVLAFRPVCIKEGEPGELLGISVNGWRPIQAGAGTTVAWVRSPGHHCIAGAMRSRYHFGYAY
jgi:hypothetical protein